MKIVFRLALLAFVTFSCGAMMVLAAPRHSEPLRLAFVTNNASDWWLIARAGTQKAAQDFNVRVDFKTPGMASSSEQRQTAEYLLSTGIDGMAISPLDPDNQGEMLNRIAAKTLLFAADYDAPHSSRACFVGTDNVAAGRQAGRELRRVLPAGGEVMVFVGRADATNFAERWRGLIEAIKGSQIRILGIRTDNADRIKARENVADAPVQYPHLAACVGLWSYNGPAILQAVTTAKRLGKTKIVCFDEDDETLQGVARGQISATIVAQPYEIGYQSIALMTKYLRGDKSVVPADKRVMIPTLVITKSNVAPFGKQLHAWYRTQ